MTIKQCKVNCRVLLTRPCYGNQPIGTVLDIENHHAKVLWDSGHTRLVSINVLTLIESEEHEALLVLSKIGK